jgi:hypothetical protein
MRRKETHPVFKPYVQNQLSLMPARLDEMIPEDHLVRMINRAIDELDLVGQLACRMPFLDQGLFGSNWAMSAGS